MKLNFTPGKLYEINYPNHIVFRLEDLTLIPINFDEKCIDFIAMRLEYPVVMFLGESLITRSPYSAITCPEKVLHNIFCDHKFQTFAFYQKFMEDRLIENS